LKPLFPWLEHAGLANPWFFLGLFLAASFLMIWRLEAMAAGGFEATALGTLVMPYCTGMGNLVFVAVLVQQGGPGTEVVTNCLVNNVTNLTLLVGLPLALWGGRDASPALRSAQGEGGPRRPGLATSLSGRPRPHDRAVFLTLGAVLLFTGVAWAVTWRKQIGFPGGVLLVALFFLWQAFHVFEVLQANRNQKRFIGPMLAVDLLLLAVCSYAIYVSTAWLVAWVSRIQTGLISVKYLGWLSGWLDVLPNAVLAFYYGWRRQPQVVYTSQIGDGHICIPLCLGLFALCRPIIVPAFFGLGVLLLCAAAFLHLVSIRLWGTLPRGIGWLLTAAYLLFLYEGLWK
jgi:cation:H+ antiporter